MNGGIIDDSQQVANEFNKFFCAVGEQNTRQKTNENIPLCRRSPVDSMMLAPVAEQEIASVIQNLPSKKTNDINHMSTWLIKQCAKHIISPLTEVINASFKDGVFPSLLKEAKVIPILKKDDPELTKNYRPISILPVFSKIYEKLFLNQLTQFLDKHSLLSEHQYGFRQGKSTSDAVISLVDMIVEGIEARESALSIFLDLTKAFDCVDHKILLKRFESYGIRGQSYKWIASFLDRTQRVQIAQSMSSCIQPGYGVPQGSPLSPLLFLVYVNDTGSSLQHGKLVQYADDTTLTIKSNSKEMLELQTYTDLNSCIQHFNQINLLTNSSKSNFISFSLRRTETDQSPTVMLNDDMLEETVSTKFLGIHLDKGLTWSFHVDSICSRVSSGIFALRKLSNYCPPNVLRMAYYGLIYPHLAYGISLWGGCSKLNFTRIFRLQKKAIRIILKLKNRESCKPGFIELGMLTLPCLYLLETAMYCRSKCVLTRGQDIHTHETRGRDNYRTGQHRTVVFEHLPSQAGVSIINSLPNAIKQAPTHQVFKARLKRALVAQAFYSVDEFLSYHWETV